MNDGVKGARYAFLLINTVCKCLILIIEMFMVAKHYGVFAFAHPTKLV